MIHTTKKSIKEHYGIDVTHWSTQQLYDLQKKTRLELICTSFGTYGINAMLLIDKLSGEFYKVTDRTNAIFILH